MKQGVNKNKSQFSGYPVTYNSYQKKSLIPQSFGKIRPLTFEGTELYQSSVAILGDATGLLIDCNV